MAFEGWGGRPRPSFVDRVLTVLILWVVAPVVVLLLWQGQFRLVFLLVLVSLVLPSPSGDCLWTCLCVWVVGMGWWLFVAGV